jgi:transposase, IS30 family
MKKKPKLTKEERFEVDHLYNVKKRSVREIARLLDRDVSAISRELRRNRQKKTGIYEAKAAHHKARVRRKYSRYQRKKIDHNRELKEYIIAGLRAHWNPDEIAGAMKREKKPFYASKTAIYEWLRSLFGQRYCIHLYSKRYYVKKRKKKTKRTLIPNRVSIERRPQGATNRTRYGHAEGDTLHSGKRGSGALSVLYERKSRYLDAEKLTGLKPGEHAETLNSIMEERNAKSVTMDNGIENTDHKKLRVPAYFCDPYSSWQKPGVENVNKMIRRYIPKGTNISRVPEEYIQKAVAIINAKPRKILGYRSALEVAREKGYIIQKERCCD